MIELGPLDLSPLNVAALSLFAVCWIFYQPVLTLLSRRGGAAINTDLMVVRSAWMHNMARRENRFMDGQLLGQALSSSSFFASSNLSNPHRSARLSHDAALRVGHAGSTGEDHTMQYLLIIYADETLSDPAVWQEITAGHMRLGAELQEKGAMVGGNRLQGSETATTVRTKGGVQSLHDGPYAETREQLGGYYLIEAPDLDAAIGWAKKIPGGPNYAVEVRPIHAM
jgi:hypothetical protein